MNLPINYSCPMGCGQTLMANEDGDLFCSDSECGDPEAVGKLLSLGNETQHLVQVRNDGGWTIQHPIHERARGTLFDCRAHVLIAGLLDNGVFSVGRYRFVPCEEPTPTNYGRLEKVKVRKHGE